MKKVMHAEAVDGGGECPEDRQDVITTALCFRVYRRYIYGHTTCACIYAYTSYQQIYS